MRAWYPSPQHNVTVSLRGPFLATQFEKLLVEIWNDSFLEMVKVRLMHLYIHIHTVYNVFICLHCAYVFLNNIKVFP